MTGYNAESERARQFLPFAALSGFEECIADTEAQAAKGEDHPGSEDADAWWEPPVPDAQEGAYASHSQSGAFQQKCESRPWDLRLARILRHGQTNEERDAYGRSCSQEKYGRDHDI